MISVDSLEVLTSTKTEMLKSKVPKGAAVLRIWGLEGSVITARNLIFMSEFIQLTSEARVIDIKVRV